MSKIICECGGSYTNRNKPHHVKTKKHIRFIEKKNLYKEAIRNVETLSPEQREALFKHKILIC